MAATKPRNLPQRTANSTTTPQNRGIQVTLTHDSKVTLPTSQMSNREERKGTPSSPYPNYCLYYIPNGRQGEGTPLLWRDQRPLDPWEVVYEAVFPDPWDTGDLRATLLSPRRVPEKLV